MRNFLAACILFLGASSQSLPTAVEEFASLQRQAHAATKSGDKHARIEASLKMQALLNDAPDAVEATAQAYAALGDAAGALAALREFADLGQADDRLLSGQDSSFASLHRLPDYKSILEQFAVNKTAVSRAETAFSLPDQGILAEDIDYDPRSKTFLITSILESKIVRVAPSGTATDFAQSPSHWPMLAIKIDAVRGLAWATEVAIEGFSTVPKSDWGRSAVLCFDLQTGAFLRRIEAPRTALGDMVLAENGDPIVSDGVGGGIYRVAAGQLTLVNNKDFISPQTPAMFPGGGRVFVPDYARGIGILDPRSSGVRWLNRGGGKRVALSGIDGLYFDHGSLILTQNGTNPERVVRLQLDSSLTQVVSEQIVERATPTLGDPTHGVIVGDSFYYIANSGWNSLDDHGNLKSGSRLTAARIMRFHLR